MSFAYWCEEQFTLVPWPGSLWKLYRHWQSQKPSHQPWAKGKEGSNDQHYIIKEANKEINQLKCCLEDYTEMEIVKKTSWEHYPKLSDLASLAEELKIDWGLSIWPASKWKKDIKSKCAALVSNKERLRGSLGNRGEETRWGREDLKQWVEDEHHLCQLSKRQEEHECKLRKGKLAGELRVVDKKLETEKNPVSSTTKWPKLKITQLRFENMCLMQVEAKLISIKEKLLYLLHSVGPKVRDGIAYLKPETVGYNTV